MTQLARSRLNRYCEPLPGFENICKTRALADGTASAKILPGEFYVTRWNEDIVTVLGSCISVCIWDLEACIGGMNHFLLPDAPDGKVNSPRYGRCAMESLLQSLLQNGASMDRLEVKVTGGGNIGSSGGQVAASNIAFVDQFLTQMNLIPQVRDVGGPHPRKVRFHPLSGKLRIQKLPAIEAIVTEESQSRKVSCDKN